MAVTSHAIIAAAGFGSRLGLDTPKSLITVCGRPIIEYQLNLLKDFEKVTMVVGFKADLVVSTARTFRKDIRFVYNRDFANTTTLQSYYIGVKDIEESHFILMDGDLIFNKGSFLDFMKISIRYDALIGVAKAGAEYGVFADISEDEFMVNKIGRSESSQYEWANLALLPVEYIENNHTFVYEQLNNFMPLKAKVVDCVEVDSISDLEYAESKLNKDKSYSGLI